MPRKGKSGIANVTSPSTADISYGQQVLTTPGEMNKAIFKARQEYRFNRDPQDSIVAPEKYSDIQTGDDHPQSHLRYLNEEKYQVKEKGKGQTMKRRKRRSSRKRSNRKRRTKRHTKRRTKRRRSSRKRSSRRRHTKRRRFRELSGGAAALLGWMDAQ